MFPNDLKKSIIQYAIEGKLVKQDINEGSAKVLIEDIIKTKEQLIKDKVIKKDKFNSYIYRDNNRFFEENDNGLEDITDQLPFEIPESWEWVRLGNIFEINSGLNFKKHELPKKVNNDILIIRGGNIQDGRIVFREDDLITDSSILKGKDMFLKKWTLITPTSTSLEQLGKCAFVEKTYDNLVYGGFIFNLWSIVENYYLNKFFLFITFSNFYRKQLEKIYNKLGSALYNIPKTKLQTVFIPIPPLNEQKRIVEKIEEISNIIDKIQE